MKQFIITKKIAKHGKQSVIVVPTILKDELKPKTIVKLTIDVLKDPKMSETQSVSEHARKSLISDRNKRCFRRTIQNWFYK